MFCSLGFGLVLAVGISSKSGVKALELESSKYDDNDYGLTEYWLDDELWDELNSNKYFSQKCVDDDYDRDWSSKLCLCKKGETAPYLCDYVQGYHSYLKANAMAMTMNNGHFDYYYHRFNDEDAEVDVVDAYVYFPKFKPVHSSPNAVVPRIDNQGDIQCPWVPSLEEIESHDPPLARYPLIPQKILIQFWQTLMTFGATTDSNFDTKKALEPLMDRIDTFLSELENNGNKFRLSPNLQTCIPLLRKWLNNDPNLSNEDTTTAVKFLFQLYVWMPGNLFIAPKNRLYEPKKNKIDEEYGRIQGNKMKQLQKTFGTINVFFNEKSKQTTDNAHTIVDELALCGFNQPVLNAYNEDKWGEKFAIKPNL